MHCASAYAIGTLAACSLATAGHQRCANPSADGRRSAAILDRTAICGGRGVVSFRRPGSYIACAVCIALGLVIPEDTTAAVGGTFNLSCVSSSTYPLDFYRQDDDGASPELVYANRFVLQRRYDVTTDSADPDECRAVADSGRHHHTGEPGPLLFRSSTAKL